MKFHMIFPAIAFRLFQATQAAKKNSMQRKRHPQILIATPLKAMAKDIQFEMKMKYRARNYPNQSTTSKLSQKMTNLPQNGACTHPTIRQITTDWGNPRSSFRSQQNLSLYH